VTFIMSFKPHRVVHGALVGVALAHSRPAARSRRGSATRTHDLRGGNVEGGLDAFEAHGGLVTGASPSRCTR
jgi:hypothetical protein